MTTPEPTPYQLRQYAGALRPDKRYNRSQAIGRIVADFRLTWSAAAAALDACLLREYCCKVGNFYKRIADQ